MEANKQLTQAEKIEELCKGRSLGYLQGFKRGVSYAENNPSIAFIFSVIKTYFDDAEAPDINEPIESKERERQFIAAAEYLANKLNSHE